VHFSTEDKVDLKHRAKKKSLSCIVTRHGPYRLKSYPKESKRDLYTVTQYVEYDQKVSEFNCHSSVFQRETYW
jgi:hypothetical protein